MTHSSFAKQYRADLSTPSSFIWATVAAFGYEGLFAGVAKVSDIRVRTDRSGKLSAAPSTGNCAPVKIAFIRGCEKLASDADLINVNGFEDT